MKHSNSLAQELEARLSTWKAEDRLRTLEPFLHAGPLVETYEGEQLINVSSNDYLGLSTDPRLRPHAIASHAGSGASRLVSGNLPLHTQLEAKLCQFLECPSTLLFSSGYAANTGTIPVLVGKEDIVFSDALNHASIIDGIRLSGAQKEIFPHVDMNALRNRLRASRHKGHHALIASDSLFSMDGDVAPVRELYDLAREFDAWLYLDEAHALGVMGPQGRGIAAQNDLQPDILVGTLGKAFGAGGAFVSGCESLIQFLIQKARSFVFSTGLSPFLAYAAGQALQISLDEPWRRNVVNQHAKRLKKALQAQGFQVKGDQGPIVPIVFGSNKAVLLAAQHLRSAGILAIPIRPPTVPQGQARLRITMMATHSNLHVDRLIDSLGSL